MVSRLEVRGICPSGRSVHRPPPSLHGVPWGRFPRFRGTMQRLRRLVSTPRFVAFARRFHPDASSFAPREHGRHAPEARTISSAAPVDRVSKMESTRPPRFPGEPLRTCPALRPRRTPRLWLQRAVRCCLPLRKRRRLRDQFPFEAQLRGLHTPCVRFAAGVTPAPRNTRFRLVPTPCRDRTFTCRVPLESFRHVLRATWLPLPPGLAWRNSRGNASGTERGWCWCGDLKGRPEGWTEHDGPSDDWSDRATDQCSESHRQRIAPLLSAECVVHVPRLPCSARVRPFTRRACCLSSRTGFRVWRGRLMVSVPIRLHRRARRA